MPYNVEEISPTRVKLTIEIPFSDLKTPIEKAYRQIANQVSIPGFRQGKVPKMVIDQRFGRGAVLEEAINEVMPKAYSDAITGAQVVPLGEPEIEVTKLEDGNVVEFTAEVDIRPEFTLPDLASLQVSVDALGELDAEVDERIEMLRERFATTTEVDRKAKNGDSVILDLVASMDGEPLPNSSSEGVNYVIGTGGMLEGLNEAVIGLKAGDSNKFESTLMGGDFAGQKADIDVTVTKVSQRELPEVDDDFAGMVSEFDTVEEMRADLMTSIAEYAKLNQVNQARNKALDALVAATEFDLPQGVVDAEVEARKQQITDQLSGAGLTLEGYLERMEGEAETAEDFWEQIKKNTIQALKAQIILDKIADDEAVSIEQNDFNELLMRKAMENNSTPQEEAKHMMEHNHLSAWTQEIRRSKAMEVIASRAQITDSAGNKVDVSIPELSISELDEE